jgi:hypothetical protein
VEPGVRIERELGRGHRLEQVLQGYAGGAFPPRSVRLALQARAVAQQLAQPHPAQAGLRQVLGDRVVKAKAALVAQAEHGGGGERLGDRADTELAVAAVHRVLSGGADVGDLAAADDRRDHGRRTALNLGAGDDLVDLAD